MSIRTVIEDKLATSGAFRRIFDTEDGKLVLKTILQEGFVFKSTFVAGDPHRTALNEGSRRLALSILKFAKKDPQEMMEEIDQILQQ